MNENENTKICPLRAAICYGDSCAWYIAYKIFGNVAATDQLMALNQQYLHTYIFSAGIVLTLPEAKTESEQPTGMVPWKKVDA